MRVIKTVVINLEPIEVKQLEKVLVIAKKHMDSIAKSTAGSAYGYSELEFNRLRDYCDEIIEEL